MAKIIKHAPALASLRAPACVDKTMGLMEENRTPMINRGYCDEAVIDTRALDDDPQWATGWVCHSADANDDSAA